MAFVAIITGSDTAHQRPWGRNFALAVGGLIVTGLLLDELTLFGAVTTAIGGFAIGLSPGGRSGPRSAGRASRHSSVACAAPG